MIEKITSTFTFNARQSRNVNLAISHSNQPADIQHVGEQQDMKQGKLHLGFSTPVTFHHPDYAKMQVTNGVFGGFAHSKLFMNVREKESMAYYASSSYASHYGLLYVMAGIDAELEDKAVTLIKEQLVALQQGDITDLELIKQRHYWPMALKVPLTRQEGKLKYSINIKSWMNISRRKN